MQRKQAEFKIKGMQKDTSESAFNSEYAFEVMNMRVAPFNGNTMFSLINEKGNKKLSITWDTGHNEGGDYIVGTPIGKAIINHQIIIFSHVSEEKDSSKNPDKIYKFWFEDNVLHGRILYAGNLGFNCAYPIETTTVFESETVQKVYWVDGINQPRIMNIASDETQTQKFDFLISFGQDISAEITKLNNGTGMFPAGTVQYVITYYQKYGQETNAALVTPTYYMSKADRGASSEETCTCCFNIKIKNVDYSFDYLRIYSIQRTSESGTPKAYQVADIPIKGLTSGTVEYTDTGANQSEIDPSVLLYIGGVEITASTLEQKDGTLFLGDLELKGDVVNDDTVTAIKSYFSEKRSNNGLMNDSSILSFVTDTRDEASGNDTYIYLNQINLSSNKIKTFKGGERYRFGIQFCTARGQWSQVFWVGDLINTIYPSHNTTNHQYNVAKVKFTLEYNLSKLLPYTIACYRLMYAQPSTMDRTVVAEGVLCPTVFNYKQRVDNVPYAVSSWFMRPDNDSNFQNMHLGNIQSEYLSTDNEIEGFSHCSTDTDVEWRNSALIESNSSETVTHVLFTITVHRFKTWFYWTSHPKIRYRIYTSADDPVVDKTIDLGPSSHKAAYARIVSFMSFIPYDGKILFTESQIKDDNVLSWGKFQSIFPSGKKAYVKDTSPDIQVIPGAYIVQTQSQNFFVDRSVVTFHSPDIDIMRDRIDGSSLKFRLVGIIPITSNATAYDIQAKNITTLISSGARQLGYDFNTSNGSSLSPSGLKTFPLWFDGKWNENSGKWSCSGSTTIYPIYPWQASGSLNGQPTSGVDSSITSTSSELTTKKLSNLRFGLTTQFISNTIWSPEISIPRVYDPEGSEYRNINDGSNGGRVYKGSYDYVVIHKDDYPKYDLGVQSLSISKEAASNTMNTIDYSKDVNHTSNKSIRIKYKCTTHAVFKFLDTSNSEEVVLPYKDLDSVSSGCFVPWNITNWHDNPAEYKIKAGDYENIFSSIAEPTEPFLWMGELYTIPDSTSWMGGTTDSALQANTWIPIGAKTLITTPTTYGTEGDTYYQRWDCLKTYPYTESDENSIIDITSFMVESRQNLDGRYDTNRNISNILYARPTNYGLINNAYTQSNGIFNYSVMDNKFNLAAFRNQITWSKSKQNISDTDTWTNITLANVLDLDGDKGRVTKLKRFSNALLCFQENGISEIQYNNLTAMSTTEGVPLEIANSGKVNGKNYLTSNIGCTNKFSICEGVSGLYFIDDMHKSIYRFNESGINDLSEKYGFRSWAVENITGSRDWWDPINFKDFTTQYDRNTKDVYFISKNSCLAFNEVFDLFTSFYSYENVPYIASIEDKTLSLALNRDQNSDDNAYYHFWEQHAGEYNMFFNQQQPFYVELIANPDMTYDKLFDNIEFRSDTWNRENVLQNTTFDTLKVWNEYQTGISNLVNTPGHPSSLKRKFRIWRANIPRSDTNGRDRMRNTWIHLKLAMNNPNVNKTILHDIVVDYFV